MNEEITKRLNEANRLLRQFIAAWDKGHWQHGESIQEAIRQIRDHICQDNTEQSILAAYPQPEGNPDE